MVVRPGLNTTLSVMSTVEAILPADCAVKFGGTPAGALLEFFNENHGHMLSGAPLPSVWDIACRFPHLLTAILSASACYLRHHTDNPLPHQMAEVYQQTLTVQSFQRSLEQPMTRERSDALLLTSIFLNLLAFAAIRDDGPLTSWVFSDDPGRLGWMTILLGFKPLFMASIRYMHESVLLPMYEQTGAQTTKYTGASFDKFELPPAWRLFTRLCADAGSDADAAITDEAVRALYATRFVPPDLAYTQVFMQFFGRLDAPFRDLLLRGDGRALWMVGYWLGLLGRLDAWFARARVRRDHTAVVLSLKARGLAGREGEEGWMWACLLDELEGLRAEWHPSNLGGCVLEAPPAVSG